MKSSGYYCTIADFELFISEMSVSFSNLKATLAPGKQPMKVLLFQLAQRDVTTEQRLILVERNLLVLSSCWNLCLYHRATDATVINIPEEATELFFAWFKGRVDVHITKH